MKTITETEATANMNKLIDSLSAVNEPIRITGKNKSAVLVSENYWSAIKETLYLTSIPGIKETASNGLKESLSDCKSELDWQ